MSNLEAECFLLYEPYNRILPDRKINGIFISLNNQLSRGIKLKWFRRLFLFACIGFVLAGCAKKTETHSMKSGMYESSYNLNRTVLNSDSDMAEDGCSQSIRSNYNYPFSGISEEKLYRETKKIPAIEYEKNASNYYILMNIDKENDSYARKFKNYWSKFIKTRRILKEDHWAKTEISGCKLKSFPGRKNAPVLTSIPKDKYLKILDYKIFKTLMVDKIYYKVEYCGHTGWINDFYTDRVIPLEMH